MSDLQVGDTAPDFTLPTDGGGKINLSSFKGRNVVLFFYPKDDTPGCTTESCGFRDALPDFEALDAAVIGVSKCSVKKHDTFKEKYNLNFPLASDEKSDVCERYGIWVEKSLYGKKYMGIERTTFLIGKDGTIAAIWHQVKVGGHVDEVRNALKKLEKAA